MASAIYRRGIIAELERLLPAGIKGRAVAAAGALGALYGLHGIGNSASVAVLFALRGIGIGDAAAKRAAERRYSMA